jgi:hypothetical protein
MQYERAGWGGGRVAEGGREEQSAGGVAGVVML